MNDLWRVIFKVPCGDFGLIADQICYLFHPRFQSLHFCLGAHILFCLSCGFTVFASVIACGALRVLGEQGNAIHGVGGFGGFKSASTSTLNFKAS